MAEQLGVKYLYEIGTPSRESDREFHSSIRLEPMPATWVASLRQAAIAVDSDLLMQLINEIPGEHSVLAQALTELVNNYCFDEIVDLTEEN